MHFILPSNKCRNKEKTKYYESGDKSTHSWKHPFPILFENAVLLKKLQIINMMPKVYQEPTCFSFPSTLILYFLKWLNWPTLFVCQFSYAVAQSIPLLHSPLLFWIQLQAFGWLGGKQWLTVFFSSINDERRILRMWLGGQNRN